MNHHGVAGAVLGLADGVTPLIVSATVARACPLGGTAAFRTTLQ
jgi:hypothetical protein